MISELLLAWRNPVSHDWVPVGRLEYQLGNYIFRYTEAAKIAYEKRLFVPFRGMAKIEQVYETEELFPIFANRLLAKSRPEYQEYLDWLNLSELTNTPLDELARSGGIRVTDDLQLFPIPKNKNGIYEVIFFSHGIRHLPPSYMERIKHINNGYKLLLMKDAQNPYDPYALAIRTTDPPEIVGYVPRFFSQDFTRLLEINSPGDVEVKVKKINLLAPIQFRLLCNFKTAWPDGFIPFSNVKFF